jgi:50S ribosomal protein L16 3-hydroxylase
LLYTVNPPSWAELLAEELRKQLLLVEDGRELAFGLGSTDFFHEGNRRRVETLIEEIGKAAARMTPDRLLAGWGDSLTARFEKGPAAAYRTEMVEYRGQEKCVLKMRAGRKTESIELPGEAAAVLKWVAARKRPFRGHEAASAANGTSPELVIEILAELETAGVIARSTT